MNVILSLLNDYGAWLIVSVVHGINSIVVFLIDSSKLVMMSIFEQSLDQLPSLFKFSHSQVKGSTHFILAQLLHLSQSHHEEDDAPAQQGRPQQTEIILNQ